jgi:hypothetical protein
VLAGIYVRNVCVICLANESFREEPTNIFSKADRDLLDHLMAKQEVYEKMRREKLEKFADDMEHCSIQDILRYMIANASGLVDALSDFVPSPVHADDDEIPF